MNKHPSLPLYAVILAGGKARRMQGKDKGLLKTRGKMLIEYTLDKLRRQVDHIFISANRNLGEYQSFNYPVYTDSFGDYAGPLAGILTALDNIHEDALLLISPCDMPALPDDLVKRLVEQLLSEDADICCVSTQDGLQPLVAVTHTRVRTNLQNFLKSGHHKVRDWLKQLTLTTIDYNNQEAAFMNINSSDELYRYEQQQDND